MIRYASFEKFSGLLVLVCSLCLHGCSAGNEEEESDLISPAVTADLISPEVTSECRAELTAHLDDGTFDMMLHVDESLHELIACGGLTYALVAAVMEVVVSLAEGAEDGELPPGFSTEWDGVFHLTPDGVTRGTMAVELVFGRDYEVGKKGERIVGNLLSASTYLVGAAAKVDWSSYTAEISYDEVGPLVELLGYGADPPNPLVLDMDDVLGMSAEMGKQRVKSIISIDDEKDDTTITYTAEIEGELRPIFESGDMSFEVVDMFASSPSRNQELLVKEWTVGYDHGMGSLDGQIDVQVSGGSMNYDGSFEYERSKWAEISVRCPE